MITAEFWLRLEGVDPVGCIEGALATGLFGDASGCEIRLDRKPAQATGAIASLACGARDLELSWPGRAAIFWSRRSDHLTLLVSKLTFDADLAFEIVRSWPWQRCFTRTAFPAWWPDYHPLSAWGFGFKAAGHELLTSRRILKYGPWRLLRDDVGDVSFVQLHDLDASEATALAQATPGHRAFGPVWEGGHYIGTAGMFGPAARGHYKPTFYERATRTSVVLVQDREVSPVEMAVAAGTRIHQVFPEPVEHVAFVFMEEAVAERQLHALWLHGLEVRAMTARGERRIDLDYEPPWPVAPDWVKRL